MRHVTENARIPQGREGLSGWCYTNPELYALECDTLFRNHWQLACHVSDLAETGDFVTFDIVGERALIVRGRDGVVRAFHNLCRTVHHVLWLGNRGHARCDHLSVSCLDL